LEQSKKVFLKSMIS